MFGRAILMLLLCFGFSEISSASIFGDEFQRLLGGGELSPVVKAEADRYHYVFVAGFFNEKIPFYFKDSVASLQDLGVDRSAITVIKPPSKKVPHDNLALIDGFLRAVDPSKPIVIIAHSKGAVEMLLYAMSNPEFVRERVQAIFLIQGAYRGSPLVDYLVGGAKVCDQRSSKLNCYLMASLRRLSPLVLVNDGFRSMSPSVSNNTWSIFERNLGQIRAQIHDKIFYIVSSQDPNRQTGFLKIFGTYLSTYFSENDGLVAVNQQALPMIGRIIAVIPDASHADFVTDPPISTKPVYYRVAFTHTLLAWLARGQ